jgi:hypothetical protein
MISAPTSVLEKVPANTVASPFVENGMHQDHWELIFLFGCRNNQPFLFLPNDAGHVSTEIPQGVR